MACKTLKFTDFFQSKQLICVRSVVVKLNKDKEESSRNSRTAYDFFRSTSIYTFYIIFKRMLDWDVCQMHRYEH